MNEVVVSLSIKVRGELSGKLLVHINYFRYQRVLEYSLSYSAEYLTPKLLVSGSPNC